MTEKHALPASLGEDGRLLWRSITAQVEDDDLQLDARELSILELACATTDELRKVERALKRSPATVEGSMGQPVPNPLLAEARAARTQIAALLGKLELDPPATQSRGSNSGHTATKARSAAHTRWRGSGA
ncbi:P27 family phage terminase small subunit [Gordonia rubripertincta]|uniref:P27 family phage terminase small subunit n=1 Tax=Gordonia rubripertincta TaxID=36822 RepID=A0AAW4G533_GORRU|nr:P27 family phage terminase small subunit [Gordonia rubripertincta]MBM7278285.1 P27 family phage terminase small subunit [Gordonia rubripertincta]